MSHCLTQLLKTQYSAWHRIAKQQKIRKLFAFDRVAPRRRIRMMRSVGTLTRADLAETINRKMGFSRAESLEMVEAILAKMSNALAKGENVKISGFGSFVLRDKNERIGRNPKTGVEVPITPRRVMTFRASQLLKERIAKG
jgi:integration host factor subunit alpha